METDSPIVYHGTSESRFPQEEIRNKQIQLTQEEIRILRECNKESFYYRCLPFALAGMAATYLAVRNGYLRSHPRWGPAGKMTGAVLAGWFLGKISYRSICEDKFLKLENSTVGDAVRKKRGYSSEMFDSENRYQKFGEDDNQVLKDDNQTSYSKDDYRSGSFNIDVDKNVTYSGLDDRERPTTDRETLNFGDVPESTQKSTSYEELRRKNREEYDRQRQRPFPNRSDSTQSTVTRKPWETNQNDFKGGSKNEYGDAWDNPKFT